ncbi:protealysin inhibitor emfourin [Herbiconiux solani]|uniref:protealysin inhibitor emfourin n=1 Tax=Herbiconiux solani TaxID=661329 RepID=UPI0008260601|nr:protealysin inhibitor emfourin [Herbiconiux solani]
MSRPQDDDDAQVLRITVARSGGVAGIAPSWTVTASAEPDVDSWLSLVESCPWDAPGAGGAPGTDGSPEDGSPGGADRFVYTIRVILDPPAEKAAATERDATVPETALDGPWRDLVDRVKQESKAAGRKKPAGRKAAAGEPTGPAAS